MTGRPPRDLELREVTAFHEAGHTVAALMRGGSSLLSVSLSDTTHGEGITWHRSKPSDRAFIAYAGPWAEVRHAWGDLALDGLDDDGCTFDDALAACLAFGGGADDATIIVAGLSVEGVAAEIGINAEDPGIPAWLRDWIHETLSAREAIWRRELEQEWPVIEVVAARLLAGDEVTGDQIAAALATT